MDKLPVVIVALDENRIEEILSRLNFKAATVVAFLVEQGDQRSIEVGDIAIPTYPLTSIEDFLMRKTDFIWLLNGARTDQMKQFLIENGIGEDFIVDFNIRLNGQWLESVKAIGDKNFIVTGAQNIFDGIDLKCFVNVNGVNLADDNQDLRQSFYAAVYAFERNPKIKFALIGLTPQALFEENADNSQYTLVLKEFRDQSVQGQLLDQLLIPNFDPPAEPSTVKDFSSKALGHWQDTLKEITIERRADVFNRNLNALENYIKLCLQHGAKPIAIVLPFAPIIRQKYSKNQLVLFRQALRQLENIFGLMTIDLFDVPLGYDCFKDMLNLNPRGAQLLTSLSAFKLHNQGVLPFNELTQMNYDKFFGLSALLMMDSYNKLLSRVFDVTVEKIRRKDKIKIGFVMYDASMWCGDLLYRLFEQNERYEPTVFLCLRQDMIDEKNFVDDFKRGVERFKARGLNVVAVEKNDAPPPRQDVMLCLMPYFEIMPENFMLENWSAETLAVYIPYGMHVSGDARVPLTDYPIMTVAWKVFLDTRETLAFYDHGCRFGLPRGAYSGYPRMDYFYSDHADEFEWKETRPRSTKIIYAPHWSIDNGIQYSTFHLNCKFIYEYAKSHPKTSWVFKPHPNLAYSAVSSGLFRSLDDYNEYVRRWEALPNARVVTGGYYQSIFASSDGMILDSGSFNAEYQYTHKPLLFLTRETQRFTDIGGELMKVLYHADGRDHKAIASFIENVLIKKKDTMSATRQKFFDEHFNYRRDNGMLASEFIFNAIDRNFL